MSVEQNAATAINTKLNMAYGNKNSFTSNGSRMGYYDIYIYLPNSIFTSILNTISAVFLEKPRKCCLYIIFDATW